MPHSKLSLGFVLLFGWHRILDDHEWLTGSKRTSVADHVALDPNVGIVIEPPECRPIHAPALARSQLGLMLAIDHFVIGYAQSTRRGDQKDRAARLLEGVVVDHDISVNTLTRDFFPRLGVGNIDCATGQVPGSWTEMIRTLDQIVAKNDVLCTRCSSSGQIGIDVQDAMAIHVGIPFDQAVACTIDQTRSPRTMECIVSKNKAGTVPVWRID